MANSAILSLRHVSPGFWTFPIIAVRSARIDRDRASELSLGGRLYLGYEHLSGRAFFGELPASPPVIRLVGSTSMMATTGRVEIGGGVQLVVDKGATLRIGARTHINSNSRILCGRSIEIGADCAISWQVLIMDFVGGHGLMVDGLPQPDTAPIRIGDRVLIGARAIVLKGVSIGDGAVIGAGSVVTRDVPAATLAAGNPARVIRERVEWQPPHVGNDWRLDVERTGL